ncbi:MAG: class I SAM-dependent methyltransferase [Gammaproteobacteria bacterium]|nr:class I SAM-dependent methyltransferase [Gammaproteobacteria bacterium]
MSFYDRHILPYVIDLACGMKAVTRQREKVVPQAQGRVLEIGIGTGLNLKHYQPALVAELTGLDHELAMHRLAKTRLEQSGLAADLVGLDAESIPLDDNLFDTIVCTYTLCTIPDPAAALLEMKRVLAPSGQLLFCEHGKAPDAQVRKWQERLNPIWNQFAGGCNLNRAIPDLLSDAGFNVDTLEQMYIPGTKFATYNYWGAASK